MLFCAYATAIGLALRLPELFCVPVMAGGHAVLAFALVLKVCRRSCPPRARARLPRLTHAAPCATGV